MNGFSTSTLLCSALLLGSFFSPDASARIYTWVDDKGEVHYGDVVPIQYRNVSNRVKLKDPTIGLSESAKSASKSTGSRTARRSGGISVVTDSGISQQRQTTRHYTHTRSKYRRTEAELRRPSSSTR